MAEIINGYYVPLVTRNYEAKTVTMEDVPVGQRMLIANELLTQSDPFVQVDGLRVVIAGQVFSLIGPAPELVYPDCQVLERVSGSD